MINKNIFSERNFISISKLIVDDKKKTEDGGDFFHNVY